MASSECTVKNLMKLSYSELETLCKDHGLPGSNLKIVLAHRLKNHVAFSETMSGDVDVYVNPKSELPMVKYKSSHVSAGTPVSDKSAAGKIVARSHERFVTHRKKPHTAPLLVSGEASQSIHDSETIMPPLLFQDQPGEVSFDESIIGYNVAPNNGKTKAGTLSSLPSLSNDHNDHVNAVSSPIDSVLFSAIHANANHAQHSSDHQGVASYHGSSCVYQPNHAMHVDTVGSYGRDLSALDVPIVPPPPLYEPFGLCNYLPSHIRQTTPKYVVASDSQINAEVVSWSSSSDLKQVGPIYSHSNTTRSDTQPYTVASKVSANRDTATHPSHAHTNNVTKSNTHASDYDIQIKSHDATMTQAQALAYAIRATKEPNVSIFKGEALQFNDWMKTFNRQVDSNPTYTDDDKLLYLQKFTGGEVADLVSSFYGLDGRYGYRKALDIIQERYGHPHKQMRAYLSRLYSWNKIQPNDGNGLQRYSDYLVALRTAMASIPTLSCLDHPIENDKMKDVLPLWLKRKWDGVAIEYNITAQTFPPFTVFVDFVVKHATRANHPIAIGDLSVKTGSIHANPKGRSLNTQLQISNDLCDVYEAESYGGGGACLSTQNITNDNSKPTDKVHECALCKSNHRLYKCEQFSGMSCKDRYSFVVKHKLCVKCLNSHVGKRCGMKIFCKGCGKHSEHNLLLHDVLVTDSQKTQASDQNAQKPVSLVGLSSCYATNERDDNSLTCHLSSHTSMIVPVYVSHVSNPSNEILTYAMLDSQSVFTFVTDKLAKQLTSPDCSTTVDLTTMTSVNEPVCCNVYSNLKVRGHGMRENVSLRYPYGCESIPNDLKVPSKVDLIKWPHLVSVADQFPPVFDVEVGLLIGHDAHYASFPDDRIRPPSENDPYAVKTPLGWSLVGPISPEYKSNVHPKVLFSCKVACSLEVPKSLQLAQSKGQHQTEVFHVMADKPHGTEKESVPMDVIRQLESGFEMSGDSDNSTMSSIDDSQFLEILKTGIHQDSEGFYSMPLPFRGKEVPLFPNNRSQALSRLKALNGKFRDPVIFEKYDSFMKDMVEKGDAEIIPTNEIQNSNVWYLPHHNVVNPKKPNKVRVVFDASAVYQGASLNKSLLSGPDLNNSLIGVLTRFRERDVAVSCDIEKMFYRFKVDESHRNFLRFLWYDQDNNIVEYRMTKHIFGATSSPGCAKYGLLNIARNHSQDSSLCQWFIEHCFYVDDGLYSCNTTEEAAKLLKDTADVCSLGNLKLHKLMSNKADVLKNFPEEDLAHDIHLFEGGVSFTERALGIEWCPSSDRFSFSSLSSVSRKITRRSMLKLVASLFDPLGFIAPTILTGKLILQRACQGLDWDEEVPTDIQEAWRAWVKDLESLSQIKIPRCLKPSNFGVSISRAELHMFGDASEKGYGTCVYLRLMNQSDIVSCNLLFGKARVVPLKGSTIPRLELQAAVLGTRISSQLCTELSIEVDAQYFWSDSQIVLAYLQNTKKKLKTYVKNRVTLIREMTDVNHWNYVQSQENPADLASRGCTVYNLNSLWFNGPQFLSGSLDMQTLSQPAFDIPDNDPEVHREKAIIHKVSSHQSELLSRLSSLSSWSSAVKCSSMVYHVLKCRWKQKFAPSVNALQDGEKFLLKQLQAAYFHSELVDLKSVDGFVKASSSIQKLDPFLDSNGLIRVGGRLRNSNLPELEKHPVIIPKGCTLSTLIISHFHNKVAHQGRGMTMSAIRSAGFWIVSLSSSVSSYIHHCVVCRKLRRPTEQQKMADLPPERTDQSPPFTYIGVDYFGPFEVKEGRRYVKRYGVIFTCLYSRAVHVELCDDMSSDAFINCLRTFISLRGAVRAIYCDQGTNLVGGNNELHANLQRVNDTRLKRVLEDAKCEFVFNSPAASHMGGSWERLIRSFREVLSGIICSSTHSLDSSSIRTVFYEAMNIVNSRPLTEIDPDGRNPLTPNHLIQMKSSIVLPPPPGKFDQDDSYSRKRWRRVQALVDQFWQRWKPHYLNTLQTRQRWHRPTVFSVGDIVMLKDDSLHRSDWKLCRIAELITSRDGLIRRVKLSIGDKSAGASITHTHLERPVSKIIMLIPSSQQ